MKLLNLEDNKDIWDFRSSNGIPLYLMTRVNILQSRINKKFHLSNPHLSRKLNFLDKLKYLFKSAFQNPWISSHKPVIIFSSGVANVKDSTGVFYNRLYSFFLELYPSNITLLESSNKHVYNTPKKETVYYRDGLDLLIRFLSKFYRINNHEKKSIENYLTYLKSHKISNLKDIANILQTRLACSTVGYYIYRSFFKLKKPKLIILEDGFYGEFSHIIKAAKDCGIVVCEYQHGYVGLNHPAYNFNCPNIPQYVRNYLPSYFLTHGEYWSKQCQIPAKVINIGYPNLMHRQKKENISKSAEIRSDKEILFCSGGCTPETIVRFIKAYRKLDPDISIVFRPHPSELRELQKRYGKLKDLSVNFDTGNLYDALESADIIVAFEVTTVLYEALIFTNKIYLFDNSYTNFTESSSEFLRFGSAKTLSKKISLNYRIEKPPSYFWENSFKEKIKDFLKPFIEA